MKGMRGQQSKRSMKGVSHVKRKVRWFAKATYSSVLKFTKKALILFCGIVTAVHFWDIISSVGYRILNFIMNQFHIITGVGFVALIAVLFICAFVR